MGLFDGFKKNWAELEPEPKERGLEPIRMAGPPSEAVFRAASAIARLPRWKVVSASPTEGILHATRTTRAWRFVDDIRLRFEADGPDTRIVGRSQSRVGKGDLGQNARNLRELSRALGGGAS